MGVDTADQRARAEVFQALHQGPAAFVIPNPWDAGSARVLASLGFAALATTSAGVAHTFGRQDGAAGRDATLTAAASIVAATDLPVSLDLEDGFGATPEQVAETIRLAAATGAVGGSIEDTTGDPSAPIHPFEAAVERVAAAVAAATALPFPFTLTARADGFLHGQGDLAEVIRRLRAFAAAGADVVYAPGLPDLDAVRQVCAAVDRPVNVLAAAGGATASVAQLSACGARRISLGSALSRAALTGLVSAAEEIRDHGTFGFAARTVPYADAEAVMTGRQG